MGNDVGVRTAGRAGGMTDEVGQGLPRPGERCTVELEAVVEDVLGTVILVRLPNGQQVAAPWDKVVVRDRHPA